MLTSGSVRTELSDKKLSWCLESWRIGGVEKKIHIAGVRSVYKSAEKLCFSSGYSPWTYFNKGKQMI